MAEVHGGIGGAVLPRSISSTCTVLSTSRNDRFLVGRRLQSSVINMIQHVRNVLTLFFRGHSRPLTRPTPAGKEHEKEKKKSTRLRRGSEFLDPINRFEAYKAYPSCLETSV